jgi:hypothetical protein
MAGEGGHKRGRESSAIELQCEDGSVYVLDADSAARSAYFAALLGAHTGSMRDGRRVAAPGDPEQIGQLVAHLRARRVPDFLGVADACAILALADYYGDERLARHCVTWLLPAVREDTALRVLLATPGREAALEATSARLVGRALGAIMRTREFLELDAPSVERVLGDPAVVPLVRQLVIEAALAWAAHDSDRLVPAAATRGLHGLPAHVAGALLQREAVAGRRDIVRALGAALTAPSGNRAAHSLDFALVIFAPCGRVFALDLRTRSTYELPPLPKSAPAPVAAVYDESTGAALVFGLGLEEPESSFEYCLASGAARALPAPPIPKARAAYACHAGVVYCIGGATAGHGYSSTVLRLLRSGSRPRWEACARLGAARSGHAAAVVGASIVVFGGTAHADEPAAERLALDEPDRAWRPCAVAAPHRYEHALVAEGADVYVLCGESHFDGRGSFVFGVDEAETRPLPQIAHAHAPCAVAVRDGGETTVWVFAELDSDSGPNVQIFCPARGTRAELRVPEFTLGAAVVFVPRTPLTL